MWNEAFRPISSDEYDLRWFDCDSVYWGKNASFRQIIDYEVGHYAGYNEVGRTEVDPIPIDPDFKSHRALLPELLYPVLAPQMRAAPDSSSSAMPIQLAMTTRGPGHPVAARPPPELRHSRHRIRTTGLRSRITTKASAARTKTTISRCWARRICSAQSTSAHSPDVRCPTDGGREPLPRPLGIPPRVHGRRQTPSRAISSRCTITKSCSSIPRRFSSWRTTCTIARAVVHQLHFVDALLGSFRAGRENRDLSVQARVPVRFVDASTCRAAFPPSATIRRCTRLRATRGSSTWARSIATGSRPNRWRERRKAVTPSAATDHHNHGQQYKPARPAMAAPVFISARAEATLQVQSTAWLKQVIAVRLRNGIG